LIENKTNPERPAVVHGRRVAGEVAVSGVAHVIRDEAELDRFREGEILVAASVPESWSHLFALAKGIVYESDDYPDYIAEAAREFDLPVINAVAGVTVDLRSADLVMMHIDGSIEQLQDRRAPDSEMRVSVPAAVRARQLASSVRKSAGSPVSNTDSNDARVVVLPVRRPVQVSVQDRAQDSDRTEEPVQHDLPVGSGRRKTS
jgi:phosphohistidine swiveling domain-containing protein